MVTRPLKQLRANSEIAIRFLLTLGVGMLALGASAVLLLSRRTTRPILDITGIASAIARMDFSPRYHGRRRDELAGINIAEADWAERIGERHHLHGAHELTCHHPRPARGERA